MFTGSGLRWEALINQLGESAVLVTPTLFKTTQFPVSPLVPAQQAPAAQPAPQALSEPGDIFFCIL